jgi:hypothetical protein
MELALAEIFWQTKAYKIDGKVKMEDKLQLVESLVSVHPLFKDLENKPTSKALKIHLQTMCDRIVKQGGIYEERINLSAIEEPLEDLDFLLYNMVQEKLLAIEERKLAIEKERQQLANNQMMITMMQQNFKASFATSLSIVCSISCCCSSSSASNLCSYGTSCCFCCF